MVLGYPQMLSGTRNHKRKMQHREGSETGLEQLVKRSLHCFI